MTIPVRSARLVPLLVAIAPIAALAQPARVPEPMNPRVLAVDPAPAPVPALRYRLLPSTADLNPGDAAPVYLRLHGYEDAAREPYWEQITEKSKKWRDLPLDRFPTAEAREFVNRWSKQFEQIEFGAHRKSCDWNYTVAEQRLDVINVALSDLQTMRQWLRLMDLKARVEMAERNYDAAVHTIETGLAFARHVAEGPFLINGLMGFAGASLLLDRCEELIGQPGAPNLYWALTVLPRPLFDLRHEMELERKLCENLIPELAEAGLDRPRTAAEWALLLSRMHQGLVKWSRIYSGNGQVDPPANRPLKELSTWDLARLKAESLPPARDYLKVSRGMTAERLAAMPDDQVVALFIVDRYHELWDDLFKASYLPVPEAIPQLKAAEERVHAPKTGPPALFVAITPAIRSVMTNGLRIERRVAALRMIEALRLHAAARGGRLPESLDQITAAPVPDDPATGEPFIYRAADSAALLHGLRANLPPPWISYRITIRR